MAKAKGHPVRAIFSGDMKEYLQGIELNKIPLEFVTRVSVNFIDGSNFDFTPDQIQYKSNDEFIEKLATKLKNFKTAIKCVDFYLDGNKLKTSIHTDTDNLFKKVK